jgi:RNA polymerase-interacting CarD/CdnL/TRCF family regulator
MRRFELGETVVFNHGGMVIGKIIDTRGWGIFKEYCVLSTYSDYSLKVPKEQLDWLNPNQIVKSDLVDIKVGDDHD